LREVLRGGTLLLDAAMGTSLMARGLSGRTKKTTCSSIKLFSLPERSLMA